MPRSPQQLDLRAVRPPRLGEARVDCACPISRANGAHHFVKDCERVLNYEIYGMYVQVFFLKII